jgi:hypothetical protein
VPVSPIDLIGGGIGGVFNYLGAKKQADAIKEASAQQAQSTQQALDFTKQQYADVSGRLKPYVDAGSTATQAASKLLGASPYLAALRPPAQFQTPTGPSTGKLITLRAPDGTTKQFAEGDPIIAQAQAKGAQIVGAAPQPVADVPPSRTYAGAMV